MDLYHEINTRDSSF